MFPGSRHCLGQLLEWFESVFVYLVEDVMFCQPGSECGFWEEEEKNRLLVFGPRQDQHPDPSSQNIGAEPNLSVYPNYTAYPAPEGRTAKT